MTIRFDEQEHEYIFSSGRTLYAHGGVIGIDRELGLSGGWDEGIASPLDDDAKHDDYHTVADMVELADMMIETWQRFKASLKEAK